MLSRSLAVYLVVIISLSACAPTPGVSQMRMSASRPVNAISSYATSGKPALALSPYGEGREILLFDRLADGQYQHFKTIQWEGGPTGGGILTFGSDGKIYLADAGTPWSSGHYVLIFAPPYGAHPTRVYVGANYIADAVTIDSKRQIFAVLAEGPNQGNPSEVLFFKTGQVKPCATVAFGSGTVFDSRAAFDGEGNLFLAEFTGSSLQFISIAGECNPQPFVAYLPTVRNTVGDFAFNASDEFMIAFDYTDVGVQTYPHPANGTLGQILETTILNPVNGQQANMLALSSDGKSIFAASGTKNVYMYHYPAGGDSYKTIQTSVQLGTAAVNPPVIP